MRLALLALALLVSAPAHAQAAFVQACVASASQQSEIGDPSAVCGCAASRTLASGTVSAAALDEFGTYLAGGAEQAVPAEMEAVAEVAVGALSACLAGPAQTPLERAMAAASGAEESPAAPEPGAAAGAAPAARPAGLRTGDGKVPVQAVQSGPGAPIRIVGEGRPPERARG